MKVILSEPFKIHSLSISEVEYERHGENKSILKIKLPFDYQYHINRFIKHIQVEEKNDSIATSLAQILLSQVLYRAYLEGRYGLTGLKGDYSFYLTNQEKDFNLFVKGNGPNSLWWDCLKDTGIVIDHKSCSILKKSIKRGKYFLHSSMDNEYITYYGFHDTEIFSILDAECDKGKYWEVPASSMGGVSDLDKILVKNGIICNTLKGTVIQALPLKSSRIPIKK